MGLDLKDVQSNNTGGDGTFAPLEQGRYPLLIEEVKQGMSRNNNEKLSITFVVLDDNYKGRKLWHDFAITPKSLPFLKTFLEATGSKFADSNNVDLKDLVIDLKNKKCTAWVEIGVTTSGTPRNELMKFKPILDDDPLSGVPEAGETSAPVEAAPKKSLFK